MSGAVDDAAGDAATTLWLVRHGQSIWNAAHRWQGQADPPLSALGESQARELGARLAPTPPDRVYTSPLRRARHTAQAIVDAAAAAGRDVPLHEDARLMEIQQGAWQGLLADEIWQRFPEERQTWDDDPWSMRIPGGGETLAEVQARVHAAIDDVVARHPGETVAIVCHRIPVAMLKIRYQGVDPAEVRRMKLANTHHEVVRIVPSAARASA
ncbi:MAG: histidine phosphatase family protein [Acidobacteriota bacterium]